MAACGHVLGGGVGECSAVGGVFAADIPTATAPRMLHCAFEARQPHCILHSIALSGNAAAAAAAAATARRRIRLVGLNQLMPRLIRHRC